MTIVAINKFWPLIFFGKLEKLKKKKFKNFWVIIEVGIEEEIDKKRGVIWLKMKEIWNSRTVLKQIAKLEINRGLNWKGNLKLEVNLV